jgi:CrcB protein
MGLLAGVMVAAAVGAPARFVLDGLVQSRGAGRFPWGTLLVNLTGSLLLGFVTGLALHHGLPEEMRVVAGAGFCGGYTTFSTFGFETARLAEEAERSAVVANVVATVAGSVAAATAGLALAALL